MTTQTQPRTAKPVLHYLAVGPFCWGRGATREEAVKEARKNWSETYTRIRRCNARDVHFSIYTCTDPKVYLSDMGGICHAQGAVLTKVQTSSLAS